MSWICGTLGMSRYHNLYRGDLCAYYLISKLLACQSLNCVVLQHAESVELAALLWSGCQVQLQQSSAPLYLWSCLQWACGSQSWRLWTHHSKGSVWAPAFHSSTKLGVKKLCGILQMWVCDTEADVFGLRLPVAVIKINYSKCESCYQMIQGPTEEL